MNFVLHGAPVSSGITVGHAHLVSTARLEVAHYEVADVEAEVKRLDAAMQRAPAEFEAFLNLHRMILNDSALAVAPRDIIRKYRSNAEWALVQQMERLVE